MILTWVSLMCCFNSGNVEVTNFENLCLMLVYLFYVCVRSGFMDCKETWCLTSTETIRLIRKGGKGYGGGGRGDYIPIATLSPPE